MFDFAALLALEKYLPENRILHADIAEVFWCGALRWLHLILMSHATESDALENMCLEIPRGNNL
jgi:hypothetical protein